jgi:hypothetical protein
VRTMVDQYGVTHLEVHPDVGPLCGHPAELREGFGLPSCLACLERLARAALDGSLAFSADLIRPGEARIDLGGRSRSRL